MGYSFTTFGNIVTDKLDFTQADNLRQLVAGAKIAEDLTHH